MAVGRGGGDSGFVVYYVRVVIRTIFVEGKGRASDLVL